MVNETHYSVLTPQDQYRADLMIFFSQIQAMTWDFMLQKESGQEINLNCDYRVPNAKEFRNP